MPRLSYWGGVAQTARGRCQAMVYRKDQLRVSRGSPSGFAMHYDRGQCARMAAEGCDGLCTQHAKLPGVVMRVKS